MARQCPKKKKEKALLSGVTRSRHSCEVHPHPVVFRGRVLEINTS
jgi:hypothetical protein